MRIINKKYFCLIMLSLIVFAAKAQDTLTLEQAIAIALKDNFSVRVAKNNVEIRENLATPGVAGLLPTIGASGSGSYSSRDTRVLFTPDMPEREVAGATSSNIQGQIGLNYVLFDGLGNTYTFRNLKAQHAISEVQSRMVLENTIIQVSNAFYQLALLQENQQTTLEALEISRERYKRQEVRRAYGSAVTSDVLNARVDLNADTVALINIRVDIENAKRNLNAILAREINTNFVVKTDVQFRSDLSFDQLLQSALAQNAEVVASRYNQTAAMLDYRLSQSNYFPTLALNAGYGYNKTNNQAGIPLFIRAIGFNAGATLSFNIFDGNRSRIQSQNAKINLQSSEIQAKQELLETERNISNTWATYRAALIVLETEQNNVQAAEANFQRSKELFNTGQINNTQFREAQLNLIRSRLTISNALYTAKLAEIELVRISGQLLN
jgi:outer membrane protein